MVDRLGGARWVGEGGKAVFSHPHPRQAGFPRVGGRRGRGTAALPARASCGLLLGRVTCTSFSSALVPLSGSLQPSASGPFCQALKHYLHAVELAVQHTHDVGCGH